MPQTLAIFLFTAGAPLWVSNAVIGLAGLGPLAFLSSVVPAALSIGIGLLAQALIPRPNSPKPEDVQQSFRQPAQPRYRHYGRVKISGPWTFAEVYHGDFYKVVALGQGEFDAIEEFWIDDNHVSLDGSGIVTTAPYSNVSNPPVILYRLGASTETAYAPLISVFSEYTSAHRGDGVASLYIKQPAVKQEDYFDLYPNGINTNYRAVVRGSKIKNPVTDIVEWDDNAASVIRDYMIDSDGLRFPESLFETTLAQAGWETAFNRADTDFDLNAGGTEKQYRLWGSYRLDERPADVLSRMLVSCDGQLKITSDGGLYLDIGNWSEPSVTLDNTCIIGFSDVGKGHDILSTANVIKATYTDSTQDYQTTDADPWIDETDVSARGEITSDVQFIMSPSHTQCRRLMKLESYRANPNWVGSFTCNLKGLEAFGERFVRITYSLLGIDEVFEVIDFKLNIAQDGILKSVTLQVRSMPEEAYQWDETTEEGTAPVSETTSVDNTIPTPSNLTLTYNSSKYVLEIEVDDPSSEILGVEYRYKLTSESDWTTIGASFDTMLQSIGVVDGEEYEVQARFVSTSGRKGAWTSSSTITIVQDDTAPGVVTLNTATAGTGQVILNWTTPNSSNFYKTKITRNTTNNEVTSSEISNSPIYGIANITYQTTDLSLASGDYYYWLYAVNASNVASSAIATGSITVT